MTWTNVPAGCPICRGPVTGFKKKNGGGQGKSTHFWKCDRTSKKQNGELWNPSTPPMPGCQSFVDCLPFPLPPGQNKRQFFAEVAGSGVWNGPLTTAAPPPPVTQTQNFGQTSMPAPTPPPTPPASPAYDAWNTSAPSGAQRVLADPPASIPPNPNPGMGSKIHRSDAFVMPAGTTAEDLKQMLIGIGVQLRDASTKLDLLSARGGFQ